MKSGPMTDATVAGYLCMDLLPQMRTGVNVSSFADLFRPGALLEVGELAMTLGGAVPNTGLALQRFGKRVFLNGLVGRDRLGDVAAGLLTAHGAQAGLRRMDTAETAYGIVIAPPGLDRIFLECSGCNRLFSSADIDFTAAGNSCIFHFGYPPLMERIYADGGADLVHILQTVRQQGVAPSLDMTLPDPHAPAGKVDWAAYLARVLPHTDIFVPSAEELLFMLDPFRYVRCQSEAAAAGSDVVVSETLCAELARACLRLGTRIVMVKDGARGLQLATGDLAPLRGSRLSLPEDVWSHRELRVAAAPADPQRLVNACGAGDAAIAGFLAALLDGATPERAGTLAALAGRDSLYGGNTLDGLRDWSALCAEAAVRTAQSA